MKKTILIVCLIICVLFTVSGVCASEANETDTIQVADEIETIDEIDHGEIIGETDDGTFAALDQKIRNADNGSEIKLENDYIYEGIGYSNGISITKELTIDGQGHKIDAKGQARMFNVTASNVTVKNITFINGKASTYGGAIYCSSNNFSVYGCTFINNTVVKERYIYGGGAIFCYDINLSVCESNFVNNSAVDLSGGAIKCANKFNISGCRFESNSASASGAISSMKGIVSGCIFVNNSAEGSYGAISTTISSISDCSFANNSAGGSCGAIAIADGANVSGCSFEDNFAGESGGAILSSGSASISGCSFVNNSADNGGAIYWRNAYYGSSVSGCSFVNNTADGSGGAIFWGESSQHHVVSGCDFVNNSADEAGGAIFWCGYCENNVVSGCKFINNTAAKNFPNIVVGGGAIFWSEKCVQNVVSGCKFISNTVSPIISNTGDGGAIFWHDECDDNSVFDCDFVNNSAGSGGAISWRESCDRNSLSNCSFSNNSASYRGGAFYQYGSMSDSIISGCVFVNNTARYAGAIEFGGFNCSVNGCYFMNNSAWDFSSIYSNLLGICNNIFIDYKSGDIGGGKPDYVSCNWCGHNATNYLEGPNLSCEVWLFLNATSNPNPVSLMDSAEITFKLYAYDSTSGNITEYDSTLLKAVNLSITPTNGNVNVTTANLGESIKYTPSGLGNDVITAKLEDLFCEFQFNVVKSDPKLSVENQEDAYGENTIIVLNYNPNATGKVNVTLKGKNGNSYSFANLDLNATVLLGTINADEYDITVAYSGDADFANATAEGTLKVNKLKTELAATAVTATYNINKDLVITLTDANGNALSGFKVTVDLNGAKTYVTNANGQVKVATKGLAAKTYTAKISFNGDANYDKSTKDVKVTVNKATPKLIAKAKTFKTSVKTKKYTITLKDNTGKAIKKAKVTMKVKGKTYKATTNSKGKATFKITKLNKKGTFKAVITYKGNKNYKKLTKKAKIKVIVTFKTVSRGSKDKSTVREIQQALKDNGYYLSYKGHYLMVDGKFNSCTQRSVKEFQHDKGLKVTGKVDEKTAKKLGIL